MMLNRMPLRLQGFFATIATTILCSAHSLYAIEVTLTPQKDSTLYESGAGHLGNGSGSHFFVGNNLVPEIRRGILKFDLTEIPAGAVINSAELRLFMSRSNNSSSETTRLHRVLSDWGEGSSNAGGNEGAGTGSASNDVTWIHTFFSGSFWTNEGGDFVAGSSAQLGVGGIGSYTWSSAQMANDVQGWVLDPSSNFGWIVIGTENGNGTAKRFDSRENFSSNNRPRLTIDYTLGTDDGACCFGDGACVLLSDTDCASQGGTFEGMGTLCAPNPCDQPIGACCSDDLTCTVGTALECQDDEGYFLGEGTTCTAGICEALLGACCFDDTTCLHITSPNCDAQGGNYQGFGTVCEPGMCPFTLTPFLDPLPIPDVATPVSGTEGGVATYEIAGRQFTQQLHTNLPPTTLWGYGDGVSGGSFPGPTIEATAGDEVTVHWINDLRDDEGQLRTDHYLDVDLCPHGSADDARMVVHLHGTHAPEESDGHPEDTFFPGEFDIYNYPNNQLPATLWYHDHTLGATRLNVYMGMAGFYLIRDQFELDLDLPSGEFEIPMIIQDRTFNQDGTLFYPTNWQQHFFGDTVLVNGKVWPYHEVKQGKYRLRLLNGSNSRTFRLSLSNGGPIRIIGGDGGLLEAPVVVSTVLLLPAERADVVIDFSPYAPGSEIILTNNAPAPFPGTPGQGVIPDVMKFIVLDEAGHTDDLPSSLRPMEVLQEADAEVERDFLLRTQPDACTGIRWLINDLHWGHITEFPVLGTTEIWRFINPSGISHPMHLHLVMFQILDIQDFILVDDEVVLQGSPEPPPPELAGWKDTVEVPPDKVVRVITRFEGYTGTFVYHCHILEHEDHEMMRQFITVECTENSHCSDGQFCNGVETCDTGTNTCMPGSPIECGDLHDCTVDMCDPSINGGAGGCVNVPTHELCDNGVFCDGSELCSFVSGCIPGPPPCLPPFECDEENEQCDGCFNDGECDDGSACTDDSCDEGACLHVPNYNEFTDCCDPITGALETIDDGDPCTQDICDPLTGNVTHMGTGEFCASSLGSRYIRVTPTGLESVPVAIQVSGDRISTGSCFTLYAQGDGSLGGTPVFLTPSQWGQVDLFGLELIPDRDYEIRLDDGSTVSDPIVVATWNFGDVDGNGTANFADVQQIVLVFQKVEPYTPACDLKPCMPNAVVNFEDIFAGVQGFQGIEYTNAACDEPCP